MGTYWPECCIAFDMRTTSDNRLDRDKIPEADCTLDSRCRIRSQSLMHRRRNLRRHNLNGAVNYF